MPRTGMPSVCAVAVHRRPLEIIFGKKATPKPRFDQKLRNSHVSTLFHQISFN